MVELSVVIPVYNSEACLEELHRQIREALRAIPHELILVDDRSTDGSWGRIAALCDRDPAVTGLRLRKNAGQDSAILCGIREAGGRFVAVMDDDLQHDPADIPLLLDACRQRALDVCYARFPVKRHAWWKRAGSWLNGRIAEIVIDKPRALYLSPFKVIRIEVAREAARYAGPFPYVDGLLLRLTDAVGEVEASHRRRFRGESQYSLVKSLLVFLRLALGFSAWPLRFSSGVGMCFTLGGFGLALFYLLQYARYERRVEGWITIVILLLVIGGLLLFSIGVVGEYLGRLYLHASGKPQSSVGEIRRAPAAPPPPGRPGA